MCNGECLHQVPDRDPDVTITFTLDRQSEEMVTIGLIDSILTMARLLSPRPLLHPAVVEALQDLHDDFDLRAVLTASEFAAQRISESGTMCPGGSCSASSRSNRPES